MDLNLNCLSERSFEMYDPDDVLFKEGFRNCHYVYARYCDDMMIIATDESLFRRRVVKLPYSEL